MLFWLSVSPRRVSCLCISVILCTTFSQLVLRCFWLFARSDWGHFLGSTSQLSADSYS